MKFSGRLQIEADPRNWLKSELTVNPARVELVSGGELLGSWSTGQVKAERLEGDRFQLQLGDERAVFAADDALAFSYEALPALAKKSVIAVATGLRGKLRKGLAADRPSHPDPQIDPDPRADATEAPFQPQLAEAGHEPPPTRRLRDLIQEAVRSNAAEATGQEPGSGWGHEPASPTLDPIPDMVETDGVHDPPPSSERVKFGFEGFHQDPPPNIEAVPGSAEPAALSDTLGQVRPLRRLPDIERADPPDSATLREPLAEQFGHARAVEEVVTAVAADGPAAQLVRTLDTIIAEVRNSEMSPVQIAAVTDLVKAVAAAIQDKNRP